MSALEELIEGASSGSSTHWREVAKQADAELATLLGARVRLENILPVFSRLVHEWHAREHGFSHIDKCEDKDCVFLRNLYKEAYASLEHE